MAWVYTKIPFPDVLWAKSPCHELEPGPGDAGVRRPFGVALGGPRRGGGGPNGRANGSGGGPGTWAGQGIAQKHRRAAADSPVRRPLNQSTATPRVDGQPSSSTANRSVVPPAVNCPRTACRHPRRTG